jgi:membrane-associated phospholipid phosphatase
MAERTHYLLAWLEQARKARAIGALTALLLILFSLSLAIHLPALSAFDLRVTLYVQHARTTALTHLAIAFTFLGNVVTLIGLGLCAVLIFLLFKRPRAAMVCAYSFVWLPLNLLLKSIIDRPRPTAEVVKVLLPAVGLSFPSGHAMGSTTFYGSLAFMAWAAIPSRKIRLFTTALFVGIILCISWSRIYLGDHWLSDVIGGWTAGLFIVIILANIYKKIGVKELAHTAPEAGVPGPDLQVPGS